MKTPYDAALRLRQREIDDMRVSINVEVNTMIVLDSQCAAIDHDVRAEREVASRDHAFSAHAFAARMYAQRDALNRERDASDMRLSALRDQAVEAYGSLNAIAAAADRHRDDAIRTVAIAEQAQLDDFSAARFTRVLHLARRLRAARDGEA